MTNTGKPNVLCIMADDIGWYNVSAYNLGVMGCPRALYLNDTGLFAFFHGHAHGTESTTVGVGLIAYASGFSLATAALHVIGIGGGLILARSARKSLLRATGTLIALAGLALIAMPA